MDFFRVRAATSDSVDREKQEQREDTFIKKAMIDGLCGCVQCPIMLAVVILVGMLVAPISGQQYFTIGKPGFQPTCRAILYPVTDMGAKIGLGPYGGGNIWKKQVIEPRQLVTSVYGNAVAQEIDMNAIVTMESPECNLLVVDGRMMEATKAMRLPMPDYCGDVDESSWHAGDDGGVWVTPIIMGAILWFLLRTLGMVLPIMAIAGMSENVAKLGTTIELVKLKIKWLAYAMFAPITTMKVSRDCPQVTTAFYSGPTQMWLTCSWFPLVLCGVATTFIAGVGCGDDACEICGGCWFCVSLVWVLSAISYYVFVMTICGWQFVLNISLDFSLDWPKFEMAYEIQVTKILLFVLAVLDVLDLFAKIGYKFYTWVAGGPVGKSTEGGE